VNGTFLVQLTRLLTDERNRAAVSWSAGGASLVLLQMDLFESTVLPNYFHHNNLCSFVRQLNMYGFTKVNTEEGGHCREYSHPHFHRDNPEWTQVRVLSVLRRIPGGVDTRSTHLHTRRSWTILSSTCCTDPVCS
jgi:hypothetical protein